MPAQVPDWVGSRPEAPRRRRPAELSGNVFLPNLGGVTIYDYDGFDHYVKSELRYDSVGSGTSGTGLVTNPVCSSSFARGGVGQGLRLHICGSLVTDPFKGAFQFVDKTGFPNLSTVCASFGFRTTFNDISSGHTIFNFMDAGNVNARLVVAPSSNAYKFQIVSGGLTFGPGVTLFQQNVFYHVALKVTVHNTQGTIDLRVNDTLELSLTGLNTRGLGAHNYCNQYRIGVNAVLNISNTASVNDYDDLIISSDFVGDRRVSSFAPSGPGSSAAFTRAGVDSGANWSQEDNTTGDNSNTNVQSANPADVDSYAVADLSGVGEGGILAVAPYALAIRGDLVNRSIAVGTLSNGVAMDAASPVRTSSQFYYSDIQQIDPGTGGVWTRASLNAAEVRIVEAL